MSIMELSLGLGILTIFAGLIIAAIAIFAFVFWILMLIDCIKRKFKSDADKVIWALVLIFVGLIGAILYYFLVKKTRKH